MGLRAARAESFDLILLDVAMPEMDGLELCRTLREDGIETPVLFLTVRGAPEDRILGLEAGGDDYLVKPFHRQELLLRIAAILRRTKWYNDSALPSSTSAETPWISTPTAPKLGTGVSMS